MTSHIFRILEIELLQQNELIIDLSSNNNINIKNQSNQQFNSYLQLTQLPQIFPSWILSEKFTTLKNKFELYIFTQYPCLSYLYCEKIMYPEKSQ